MNETVKICKGCGNKRGSDHCEYPSKQGPAVTDPAHPSNDGTWAAFVSAMLRGRDCGT